MNQPYSDHPTKDEGDLSDRGSIAVRSRWNEINSTNNDLDESYPEYDVPVLCRLKRFGNSDVLYQVLKAVDEDDCVWRTVDDNSELDEWNLTVTHWQSIDGPMTFEGEPIRVKS